MAGKRQHYVPRFLQRGFLIEWKDSAIEAERTWLHRLGAPARPVGIGDVGVVLLAQGTAWRGDAR